MYWLLEAPWCDEYPGEGASLVALIKERILGMRFQNQQIRFDPVSHFHLTKTQLYKFNKAGLSAAFLTPTAGEPFKLGWTS
jgi:hypothetical protein